MNQVDVCLSPLLFRPDKTGDNTIIVIVDVLRATSAFCAAFESGVKTIFPVANLEKLKLFKKNGYLTAAERDGEKVDFADFGNSPVKFLKSDIKGKEIAYSTTNGTMAVEKAKKAKIIVAASFVNLNALCEWIIGQQHDMYILCSGWKNEFSLEDTLCAGAIIETTKKKGNYELIRDSATASLIVWQSAKNDLSAVIQQAAHYKRLKSLGFQEDLDFCFSFNSTSVVPLWDGSGFKNGIGTKL